MNQPNDDFEDYFNNQPQPRYVEVLTTVGVAILFGILSILIPLVIKHLGVY